MRSDRNQRSLYHQLREQLTQERRNLRDQKQRLARLKYEWNIAKRLRHQASNEDEREKWAVQSDAYLGLIVQQENTIAEIRESIARYESRLTELERSRTDQTAG